MTPCTCHCGACYDTGRRLEREDIAKRLREALGDPSSDKLYALLDELEGG